MEKKSGLFMGSIMVGSFLQRMIRCMSVAVLKAQAVTFQYLHHPQVQHPLHPHPRTQHPHHLHPRLQKSPRKNVTVGLEMTARVVIPGTLQNKEEEKVDEQGRIVTNELEWQSTGHSLCSDK
jgi:hypothetical protein